MVDPANDPVKPPPPPNPVVEISGEDPKIAVVEDAADVVVGPPGMDDAPKVGTGGGGVVDPKPPPAPKPPPKQDMISTITCVETKEFSIYYV